MQKKTYKNLDPHLVPVWSGLNVQNNIETMMGPTFYMSSSSGKSVYHRINVPCCRSDLWNQPARSKSAIAKSVALSVADAKEYPHTVKNHIYEDTQQHWPIPAEQLTGLSCFATKKLTEGECLGPWCSAGRLEGYPQNDRNNGEGGCE